MRIIGQPIAEEKLAFHVAVMVSVAIAGILCAWLATWFVILPAINAIGAGTDPWEGANPVTRSVGALIALYAATWCAIFLAYKGRAKIYDEGLVLPWGPPGKRYRKYEELKELTLFMGASHRWALGLELPNRGPRIMLIRPKTTLIASFLLRHADGAFVLLSEFNIPRKPYPGGRTY